MPVRHRKDISDDPKHVVLANTQNFIQHENGSNVK